MIVGSSLRATCEAREKSARHLAARKGRIHSSKLVDVVEQDGDVGLEYANSWLRSVEIVSVARVGASPSARGEVSEQLSGRRTITAYRMKSYFPPWSVDRGRSAEIDCRARSTHSRRARLRERKRSA